jgi:hypothetical protein
VVPPVHVPAFSDGRPGVPVEDDAPAYVAWRRVPGTGPALRTLITKRTTASLDYHLDFRPEMNVDEGEQLVEVTAWFRPVVADGFSVPLVQFTSTRVIVWLAGGELDGRYEVLVAVRTNRERPIERSFAVVFAEGTVEGITPAVVTGDYLAAPGALVRTDSSGGSFTITLPASAGPVTIRDVAHAWNDHPVTVAGNGRTIEGEATFVLDTANYEFVFTIDGATWVHTRSFIYGDA